jgi:hypothetical protein
MNIDLTEPQARFFRLDCKYPLFVGGYGSGKSFALMVAALRDLFLYPGARVGVYSDTYDQLRLNIAPRLEDMMEEAGIPYKFNKTEWTLSVNFGQDVNEIIMRSIDNPKRIIGYEVFRSHVDEIEASTTEAKAEDVWRKIVARNRQKCGTLRNRVSAYTTPDQGFGFTYKKWSNPTSSEYQYVQAATKSNHHLPPDYVDALAADYSDGYIDAYLNGAWCNLTSGTVYSAFNRETCNSDREIQPGEPLHIGMDFNVNNMAAVVFVQESRSTIAADELIGYADTPAMIEAIKGRYAGHNITIYPDATGIKTTSSGGASISDITLLRQAGFAVRADSVNPRVRSRIVCVNARLADGTVKVNVERCPQVAEALERQIYDKHGEPDKTQGFDHSNDAFGYRVCYSYPLRAVQNRKIYAR